MRIQKIILSLLLVSLFCMPAYASSVIFGAKAGYFVWEPYLQELGGFFSNMKKGPGVLYGPVFSVIIIPKISFSIAGLTGKQSTSWAMDIEQEGNDPDDIRAGTYNWELKRYDLDSALSYRLSEKIKLFLGYKLQYTVSDFRQTEVRNNSSSTVLTEATHSEDEITTFSNGPAIGAGYAFVFGNGFFAAANLSALYMRGYLKIDGNFYYSTTGSPLEWQAQSDSAATKVDTMQFGLNFEPSLGYKPSDSGIIFTLGFRYQWLRTELVNLTSEDKELVGDPSGLDDYQYGIFVSVLYTI